MAGRPSDGEATTIQGRPEGIAPARLCLVVVGDGTFATHPLPDSGEVSIGRSERNEVRINEPSVSREHAILRIGEGLSIEDLGSANGTRVGEQALAPHVPVPVLFDHVVEIGSTLVLVQRTTSRRPRRLWTHGYFEARLEDECARAEATRSSFAVLRLDVARGETARGGVQEVLSSLLGSADVVAAYGPDEYEILMISASPEQAAATTERILRDLEDKGMRGRTGLACHPKDGRTPEALIGEACVRVRGLSEDRVHASVIVEDPAMQQLYKMIDRVSQGTISVLLLGETGVGKEILAQAVHERSPRKKKPFVRLNCGALSESLLDAELFGYEKGAFTGADKAKRGLIEAADGGTLFLDELGEMPMTTQVKLLRVLEERRVRPVGGLEARPVDVRFVAATNRDLEQEVALGRFRADLYFRLNGIALVIPPLRERKTEIGLLLNAFVERACREAGMSAVPRISEEALALLEAYAWPGNIRELRNVMERAVLLQTDGVVRLEHLPVEKMRAAALSPTWGQGEAAPPAEGEDEPLRRGQPNEEEKRRIWEALERCAGNQTQAAKLLGFSRRTLVSRLGVYGFPRPRKGAGG